MICRIKIAGHMIYIKALPSSLRRTIHLMTDTDMSYFLLSAEIVPPIPDLPMVRAVRESLEVGMSLEVADNHTFGIGDAVGCAVED